MRVRIAVDAMGGDHAPDAPVTGTLEALRGDSAIDVILVGDRSLLEPRLQGLHAELRERITIVHASQVIGMSESPVEALRRKRDSSLMTLAKLGANRGADAVISAGNTGAFAAACQLKIKPLDCVQRPGVAVTIPSFHGPFVLCDVGANIQAKPRHLYEYGVMAGLYAQKVLGIESPRVAILSVGPESEKGTQLVRQTHELLEADDAVRFVGNVEGRDLFLGRCDVAICDGFVGNIALKFVEGLAEGLFETIAREVADESPEIRERFIEALDRVRVRHDYSEYGGAPLLGIDGVSLVCHGRSDGRAIRNAIVTARRFVELGLTDAIVSRLGSAILQD